MSFVSGNTDSEAAQKFLEILQNDFKNLSAETKKKYPQIKEVMDPYIHTYMNYICQLNIKVIFHRIMIILYLASRVS